FAYDPLTGAPLGLLVEPQDTNIIPDNTNYSGWLFGNLGGTALMEDPAVGRYIRLTSGESAIQAAAIAASLSSLTPIVYGQAYFRAGTHRYAAIGGSTSNTRYAIFDLVEGTVTAVGVGVTSAGMLPV